jgi:hypothetical protein
MCIEHWLCSCFDVPLLLFGYLWTLQVWRGICIMQFLFIHVLSGKLNYICLDQIPWSSIMWHCYKFMCFYRNMCLVSFFFFKVGSISHTSVEMQTRYTIKHNHSLQYSNVINVSVHQNNHQAPLLQMLQSRSTFATHKFFVSEIPVYGQVAGLTYLVLMRIAWDQHNEQIQRIISDTGCLSWHSQFVNCDIVYL